MATLTLARRTVLRNAALATTALATPFVRGAHAARWDTERGILGPLGPRRRTDT